MKLIPPRHCPRVPAFPDTTYGRSAAVEHRRGVEAAFRGLHDA